MFSRVGQNLVFMMCLARNIDSFKGLWYPRFYKDVVLKDLTINKGVFMKTRLIFTVLLLSGIFAVFFGCGQSGGGKVEDVVVYAYIKSEGGGEATLVIDPFDEGAYKGKFKVLSPHGNKEGSFKINKDGPVWKWKDDDETERPIDADKKLKFEISSTTYYFLLPNKMLP